MNLSEEQQTYVDRLIRDDIPFPHLYLRQSETFREFSNEELADVIYNTRGRLLSVEKIIETERTELILLIAVSTPTRE